MSYLIHITLTIDKISLIMQSKYMIVRAKRGNFKKNIVVKLFILVINV